MENYVVVERLSQEKLEKAVNEKIQEGYIPVGNVQFREGMNREMRVQAMVKKEIMDCHCEWKNHV